jgi:hypothetical protein
MGSINSNNKCQLEQVTWDQIRLNVQKVNPELFAIIEQISPAERYKLFKISYLYGEKITDLGTICVPNKFGKLVRLDDKDVDEKLKKQLDYCPTPLIMQLNNCSEVFIEAGERIIPLNVFNPGDLYGLFEAIVPLTGAPMYPCWSVTSGGRSVFFAAKVTDAVGHKKLKAEFGIKQNPPQTLTDQWKIFRMINNRSPQPWFCEVLVFPSTWIKKRDNDISWLRFQNYLLTKAWIQSRNTRAKAEYSAMWESFSSAVCSRNLKPGPYIVNTVMHLLFLANSTAPGFKVINNENNILPFTLIEKAYLEVYKLRGYAPLILRPCMLAAGDTAIYYSMAYPTLYEGTPAIRHKPNIISEVREVKMLMEMLQRVVEKQNKYLFGFMRGIQFEYYHSDKDTFEELKNSNDITNDDPLIHEILATKHEEKKFPSYGQFFRGCIRISKIQLE